MTWILILVFFLFIFFYGKYLRKKQNTRNAEKHTIFIEDIRTNWNEIRIKIEDCIVINYNTKIDKNSPIYSLTNEKETFYNFLNKDSNKIDLVDLSRSKITCHLKENGKVTQEFSKTVDMDFTKVKFKLGLQKYVSIYFPKNSDDKNYYIDLEFLNEEIDITQF